jgi:hypothetical protein
VCKLEHLEANLFDLIREAGEDLDYRKYKELPRMNEDDKDVLDHCRLSDGMRSTIRKSESLLCGRFGY